MQSVGNWKNFFDISFLKEIVRLSEEEKEFAIREDENGRLLIEEFAVQIFDDGVPYSKKECYGDLTLYTWYDQEGNKFRENDLPTMISAKEDLSCLTFFWPSERKSGRFIMNSHGIRIIKINDKVLTWDKQGIALLNLKKRAVEPFLRLSREEINKIIAGAV